MTDNSTDDQADWTLVLKPKRGWLDIDLREIYRYRDLIWMFVNRDFVTVYKQTILGPLWFILNPLFTTIMYSFVFGQLAKIPTDGVPQTLFYYGGSMLWGYFSTCLNSASDTFSGNSSLFSKVYFPRLTVPISKVFSNLISAGIQFATLIVFYVFYVLTGASVRPTWAALLFPLIFLQLAALGTGFGMIISSLTTKYRDLRQLIGFGISLWMYATPIVYPLSQVPAKYKWLMELNPVSAPIEAFRAAFYGVGGTSLGALAGSIAATLVILFLGLILFNRNERTFVDVV
ncbi:MAG TPA: ABC transporter permease [Rectinemataceae bacterium]|nr:ABC transporter permease [Rectinemataceae bacterium]